MYILETKLPDDVQKEYLEYCDIIWFVAFDDDNTWMGFGGIRMDMSDYPYLGPTFVKEEFRGKGIQRMLIEEREAWCKKKGFLGLTTCVYEANIYSRTNVEAMGFKKIKNYCDEIWYFKSLEQKVDKQDVTY